MEITMDSYTNQVQKDDLLNCRSLEKIDLSECNLSTLENTVRWLTADNVKEGNYDTFLEILASQADLSELGFVRPLVERYKSNDKGN